MGINDTNLLRELVKLSTSQVCSTNALSECICGIKSELGKMNERKDKDNKDLEDRISELENKGDNYITDISYERDGGNIILKYTYVDGQIKTVTLEDRDAVGILYDDTEVRNKITNLENEINTLKSDIAELKEFKDMITELLDGNIGGWRP